MGDMGIERPKGVESASIELSMIIAGDPERLCAALVDWANWPHTFPKTIRSVRAVALSPPEIRLEVDHRTHGAVTNILRFGAKGDVRLMEAKPSYDAEFRFEPVEGPDGGRLRIGARIRLKGWLRWFAFAAAPVVRSRMRRYLVDPLRRRAGQIYATPAPMRAWPSW